MSRWADAFAALSGGADTVDTPRHNGEPAFTVSHSVHSVTAPPEPATALPPPTIERATAGEAEAEHTVIVEPSPLLLADGRRLHRSRADAIPSLVPADTVALLDQARWYGAVLVADGCELIVVERWQSMLPPETLQAVKGAAGAVIAALRGESRRRSGGHTGGPRDD